MAIRVYDEPCPRCGAPWRRDETCYYCDYVSPRREEDDDDAAESDEDRSEDDTPLAPREHDTGGEG
jgi:hypothetical protein